MQNSHLNIFNDSELTSLDNLLSVFTHQGGLDDITKFKRIWFRVILQQFADAGTLGEHRKARNLKENARKWLTSGSEDFKLVCDYCGLESETIRRICERIFNSPDCESHLRKFLPNTRMNGKRIQSRGPRAKTIYEYTPVTSKATLITSS